MPSAALATWVSVRADRIDRLQAAHRALGGTGRGRRWVTDELNHALILRLASEFQGFSRDLHNEAGLVVTRAVAPGNQQLQDNLRIPFTANRKLDHGNADPGTLGLPQIGSRVRVPWGLGTAEGEVVDAYHSGVGGQVVVAVHIEGCDQALTATFRSDSVELAERA